MSAHFFTSLHPCLTQSGTYDGVESRGWSDTHSHCSAQFTSLITPNISIERPDAHLADGPTQDVAMANHRPYLRALTHVFHYVRCFIYTRHTGSPLPPRLARFPHKYPVLFVCLVCCGLSRLWLVSVAVWVATPPAIPATGTAIWTTKAAV